MRNWHVRSGTCMRWSCDIHLSYMAIHSTYYSLTHAQTDDRAHEHFPVILNVLSHFSTIAFKNVFSHYKNLPIQKCSFRTRFKSLSTFLSENFHCDFNSRLCFTVNIPTDARNVIPQKLSWRPQDSSHCHRVHVRDNGPNQGSAIFTVQYACWNLRNHVSLISLRKYLVHEVSSTIGRMPRFKIRVK